MAGTHLDNTFLEDPERPVDQLRRWHFRQAVLVKVSRRGEPGVETDFPPGSDMIDEIMSSPKAGKWMESKLFNRLAEYANTERRSG